MTVESVDKRERRLKRARLRLARFKHSANFFEGYEALKHMASVEATWEAVRRVASEIVNCPVQDVMLAWQIARFVKGLPDGEVRMKAAVTAALAQWDSEASE